MMCRRVRCYARLAADVRAQRLTAWCSSAGTFFQDEQAQTWELVDDLTLDLTPAINGGAATLPSDSGARGACLSPTEYCGEHVRIFVLP